MKTAIWNPSTDVWTPMAEMKQGREFHGCSVFTSTGGDKYVLVAGGSYNDDGWKSRSTAEIYDVQGKTWTFAGDLKQGTRSPGGPWRQHSTMNTHRKSHASAVTGDTLHMVAGGSSRDTASSLEDKRWKERGKLPYSIGSGACAVTINETAVFVTG